MARPREFDIEKAREDAMNVFWDAGYKGTSLPDLLEGAGLSRGSLYKAFGSKKELFIEALGVYDSSELQPGIKLLKEKHVSSGAQRVESFFSGAITLVMAGDRRGCLLCNAAVEGAAIDSDIARVVSRMLDAMTSAFAAALADCDAYKNASDAEQMARANGLTMSYIGLRVLARSGAPVSRLKDAATASLLDLN